MVRKGSIVIVMAIAAILANAASATAAPAAQMSKPSSSLASVNLFGGAPVAGQKSAHKYAAAMGAPPVTCDTGYHLDDGVCVVDKSAAGAGAAGAGAGAAGLASFGSAALIGGAIGLVALTSAIVGVGSKGGNCTGVSNC